MNYEKIDFKHYYDGPYIDSGKSQEEREEEFRKAVEEDKKLKDWSEVDH